MNFRNKNKRKLTELTKQHLWKFEVPKSIPYTTIMHKLKELDLESIDCMISWAWVFSVNQEILMHYFGHILLKRLHGSTRNIVIQIAIRVICLDGIFIEPS